MTGSADPMSTFLHHAFAWASGTYINIEAFEWVPKVGGSPGEGALGQRKASRAARDLREATGFTRWCNDMGWEVYARMAAGKNPGTGKVNRRGATDYRAMGSRANAVALKSFFIDVDVKARAHKTPEEAKIAVATMCSTLGMPLPTMVVHSGGGGFHAHWVLDQSVDIAEWDLIAPRLAEACRQQGVLADHNIAVNAVCLLRIPGTSNRKYGTARPVVLELVGGQVKKEELSGVLPAMQAPAGNSSPGTGSASYNFFIDPLIFPVRAPVNPDAQFLAGISPDPFTLEELGTGCPWIKKTLETHGKDQREPLWFEAANVAVFTERGEADFHRLSDGHAGYDREETKAKYDRAYTNKQTNDQGWPRCATIHGAGAVECGTCTHLAQLKSPFNYASREITQPGNDPQGPEDNKDNKGNSPQPPGAEPPLKRKMTAVDGYADRVADGIYSKTETKGDKTYDVEITSFPVWNLDYLRGADNRFAIHFDTSLAKKDNVHVTLRTDQETDTITLKRCLGGDYGLPMHEKTAAYMMEFMASFKDQMRLTRDVIVQQELMGWSDKDGKDGNPTGFVYGPKKYTLSEVVPFYQPETMIKEQYYPVGSIDPWMEAIRMINAEQRPEMDILVATAFAAPLMRFTGEKGVVISAFSSGTAAHKTTAIKIGQAVWGAVKGINQLSDTLNSVMVRVGKTRIVPTYYDEMKSSLDTKKFVEMLYTFVGGRGKGRLNRNAELRDVDTWETLLVGVSNDSLFDFIAQADKSTDAGVSRVFEFEIRPPTPGSAGQVSMGKAGEILKKLETNYGRAGEIYAEYLGKNADTLQRRVTEAFGAMQELLGKAPNGERFWVAAATVLLMGAQIANDLKLTNFDIKAMCSFIVTTFAKMRGAKVSGDLDISKNDTLKSILASYINSNRRSVLATDTAGRPGRAGAVTPVNILNLADVHLVNEYTVRYIDDTKTMRISRPAFTRWLKERAMSPGVTVKNLTTNFGAKTLVASITSGTSRPASPERVIELDLNHPDLIDLYEV